MTGNMTGGTVTGGNMTVSISSFDESESDGGTVVTTAKVDVLNANLCNNFV